MSVDALDLHARLVAALDERERLAQKATQGEWTVFNMADDKFNSEDGKGWWWVWRKDAPFYAGVMEVDHVDDFDHPVGGASITDQQRGQRERDDAEHIAAHDPATVLRETAALRDLLALHPADRGAEDGFTDEPGCRGCMEPAPCRSVLAVARLLGVEP